MAALLPCMWRRAKYTVVGLQKAAHYNGAFCITSTAPHPRLSPIRPRASSSLSFDDSFCTCPALPKPGAGQQCIILGVKPYSGGGGRTRVMTRLLNDEQNQLALHRSCARAVLALQVCIAHTFSLLSSHRIPRPHADPLSLKVIHKSPPYSLPVPGPSSPMARCHL